MFDPRGIMTTANAAYEQLNTRFKKISAIGDARGILGWDMLTIMPKGASEARGEAVATLDAISHEALTDPRVGDWLNEAEGNPPADPDHQVNLAEMRRLYAHASAVEPALVEALSRAGSRCYQVWTEARPENRFDLFAPALTEVLGLVRQVAAAKSEALGLTPYDALIDQFEPSMRAARIAEIFAPLREQLPPMIGKVIERQAAEPAREQSSGPFPIDAQRELGLDVMKLLGFDFDRGRLDVSPHPFCGGATDDVRITTRYREDDFASAMMGVAHETGHALYELNRPAAWRGLPAGTARGMAVHESQSLFVEMQLFRSKPLMEKVAQLVNQHLGPNGSKAWTGDDLFSRFTRVKRSLIRVDADEVTYPLHVILRFELEQALIAGSLEVRDLPDAWNDGMERLLGIRPDSDQNGCMQDVHWTDGSFGYFPSYTLGAMIAAQLAEALRLQMADFDGRLGRGELQEIRDWMKVAVHEKGSLLTTDALVKSATGAPLGADALLRHLGRRYLG
jgi:carboxypeptidase Taq